MKTPIIYSNEYRNHYAQFINYLQAIGYSKMSCATFASSIRNFLYWLEKNNVNAIEQVSENDIQNFHAYEQERLGIHTQTPLSEKRIYLNMYAVKIFFSYLQAIEVREDNPMNGLHYPTPAKQTRENLLTPEDIQKLYAVSNIKQRALLALLYGCGLRREEAVKVNTKDLHFRSAMLYVQEGKGSRKRIIPLSEKVVSDLKAYYHEQRSRELNYSQITEAFMLNKRGRRMLGGGYSKEIKKLIMNAHVNQQVTLHHFRHAIATHLLENGMKTQQVKDFLGHMSIETTQTYTHLTTTQMKKTTAYGTQTIPV